MDEGGFVGDAPELTYNINRVAARLRMHQKVKIQGDLFLSSSGGEAEADDRNVERLCRCCGG